MSRAFGPKGVRARLIASFQLPAHGPAPPRHNGRCRRLEIAERRSLRREARMRLFEDRDGVQSAVLPDRRFGYRDLAYGAGDASGCSVRLNASGVDKQ